MQPKLLPARSIFLQLMIKKFFLIAVYSREEEKTLTKKTKTFKFDPKEIDALILSHAHIDHCGNIPHLVKDGFNGPIYTTSATKDLCKIMLEDSAHLQQRDIEWLNKRKKKRIPEEPLYSIEDVDDAINNFIPVDYNTATEIFPGVVAYFQDAGHILGSAGILLEIEEEGRKLRFGFSGDIGRPEMPIIRNPDIFRDLDILIMESTYGNRLHTQTDEVEEEVAKVVREVFERRGKIIIPSFAVGRTQLLVYVLHKLFDQNRIPEIPIYVDSPLALKATEVFKEHPECFDRETNRIFLESGDDPFGFKRLKYITTVDESKELNETKEAMIIISASGMAEGGRILHHLANNISNSNNLILFVGYAAQHTLSKKNYGWNGKG